MDKIEQMQEFIKELYKKAKLIYGNTEISEIQCKAYVDGYLSGKFDKENDYGKEN